MASRSEINNVSALKMRLEEEICTLISEAQEFNLSTIERIEVPTALEFHRYVSANRPVIITLPSTATTIHEPSLGRAPPTTQEMQWTWPAYTKWTNEYLAKTLGQKEITVACTPNGWADAVVDDKYFAMPCEKKMTFDQFLDGMPIRTYKNRHGSDIEGNVDKQENYYQLKNWTEDLGLDDEKHKVNPYHEVRYIQLQNGNLMTEYEELLEDIPSDIPFASEALAKNPDAVNFWYGDERSTTSLHKEKQYIAATYVDTQNPTSQSEHDSTKDPLLPSQYKLEPMEPLTYTKWIALNPSHEPRDEILEKYPRFHMCQPFKVELNPGELLYLPAMWYHQVEQEPDHEGKCIAVNWWYDMGFEGDRFATATFMSNLIQLVDQIEDS
ncbi:JmjC domain-containing protein 7 [Entomortierella lignicola]|nr:JmjC domain-containing protein 7 [Entomortierella lignicola]